jgi:hypothetical protein
LAGSNACGGEDGVCDLCRREGVDKNGDVGGAVKRQAALVAGLKIRLISEDGAGVLCTAASVECGSQSDFEMDEEGAGAVEQQMASCIPFDCASAKGEDQGIGGSEACDGFMFAVAKGGFAVAGEELGDGHAGFSFKNFIGVEESPAEALCDKRADGGLTRAHEASEDDTADRSLIQASLSRSGAEMQPV